MKLTHEELQALVLTEAVAAGVQNPELALAMFEAENESRDTGAVSERAKVGRGGAIGLTQIMPATAEALGFNIADLADARTNVQAGLRHFATVEAAFPDDQAAQVGAYNAGVTGLRRKLAAGEQLAEQTQRLIRVTGEKLGSPLAPGPTATPEPPPTPSTRGQQLVQEMLQGGGRGGPSLVGGSRGQALVNDIIQGRAGAPAPNTARPNAPPLLARAGEFIAQPLLGAVEGAAALPGLPFDLLNTGLRAAGVHNPESFLPSSRATASTLTMGATERFPPRTLPERVLRRGGEEVGAGLTGAGIIGTAARPFRAAAALPARQATTIPQRMLADIAKQSPGDLLKLEARLGAVPGLTAGAARELFPDNPQMADFAGQLVGAFGVEGARMVIGSGGFIDRMAQRRLQLIIGTELPTPANIEAQRRAILRGAEAERPGALAAGIAERDAIQEVLPDFQPTTAQVAGTPELRSVEQSRRQTIPAGVKAEDAFFARFERQQATNQGVIRRALEEAIPATGEGVLPAQSATRERATRLQTAAADAADAQIRLEPGISTAEADLILRAQLARAKTQFKEEASALYDAVPRGTAIPTGPMRNRLRQLNRDTTAFEDPGDTPLLLRERTTDEAGVTLFDVLLDAKNPVETLPFSDVRGLRSRLLADIRAERGAPVVNERKIRKLNMMLDGVEQSMDTLLVEGGREAIAAYTRATTFFREGVTKFNQGTVADVLQRRARGDFAVPEGEIARRFLRTGPRGEGSAQDFIRAVGGDAPARAALRSAAINELAEFGVKPGTDQLQGARLRTWLQKRGPALRRFPELETELGSLAQAQTAIENTRAATTQSLAQFEKSHARFFLEGDPESVARQALRDRVNLRANHKAIVATMQGDAAALNGYRRAVWDVFLESALSSTDTGSVVAHPQRARKFIQDHRPAFEELFTPEEMARTDLMLRGAEMSSRSNATRAPIPQDAQPILNPNQLFSRYWSVMRLGLSKTFFVAEQSVRAVRRQMEQFSAEQMDRLMQEALFDPEVAQTVLAHMAGAEPELVTRRLRVHLSSMAHPDDGDVPHEDRLPASPLPPLAQMKRALDRQEDTPAQPRNRPASIPGVIPGSRGTRTGQPLPSVLP